MSSKKGQAKVSQADLRKMMQRMKNKKQVTTSSGSIQKLTINNGSNHSKRKITEEYFQEKIEQKKLKITKDTKDPLPQKTALIKNYHSKIEIEVQKSDDISNQYPSSVVSKSNGKEPQAPVKKLQKLKPTAPKNTGSNLMPLVSGFYSDSSSSSDEANVPSTSCSGKSSSIFKTGTSNDNKSKQPSFESSLPAGFFDDPETDAKMRGVETPADKMDREWEAFQKELQHETVQSEQLIEEEQDTGHLDREIDEIDEQIQYYNLIDKLCDKKDQVFNKAKQEDISIKTELPEIKMEVNSSSDEDDALDWREKDAFT